MSEKIRSIFVTPPLAFARLGGSSVPQCAYDWTETRAPRTDGETTISPTWSLAVQPDGSTQPFLPDSIAFRDGDLIRPVAPFFEFWARIGDETAPASAWRDVPLTPALLEAQGLALAALRMTVTARNLKAARRTQNPQLAFGTFPPLSLVGSDTSRHAVLGVSPPAAATPMIPRGRHVPLGSVQFLRSVPQRTDQPWSDVIDVETIRFRYTPATGLFYGPPEAAQPAPQNGRLGPAVRPEHAFLDPAAGWRGTSTGSLVEPGDTYDAINPRESTGPSLGVVDDTCEVHFDVALSLGGDRPTLTAKAVAFVGPPDFAPDRRPFLSVADELNDRSGDASARSEALDDPALDRWVVDLFERVYETVSLLNVDFYRSRRAKALPPEQRRAADLDAGARPEPDRAMGGKDALRSPLYRLAGPTNDDPLPLSEHARMRHRVLSDLQALIELVALDADRIRSIVRPPFEVEDGEDSDSSSMRMPPFMRQSNALPLTLANWQHALLMRWVERTTKERTARPALLAEAAPSLARVFSPTAAARRERVLARIDAAAAVSRR